MKHLWPTVLSNGISYLHIKHLIGLVSISVTSALLIWSVARYHPPHIIYGPRALYSFIMLSLLIAFAGRIWLFHLLKLEVADFRFSAQKEEIFRKKIHLPRAWRLLFLLDIGVPLYLAAGVLINTPAAVLTAIVTQICLQGYTLVCGFVSWREASYRVATTALLVFIPIAIYKHVAPTAHHPTILASLKMINESREFLSTILIALMMLLLVIVVTLSIVAQNKWCRRSHEHRHLLVVLREAWHDYTHSPVLLFQILMLSVGTLIPIADAFDDIFEELAWLFFLVPLFAIYCLALNTTRLSIRTEELQHTLQDLNSVQRQQGELRDYVSLITRVQEEERRRLARELHDDTAQALIALSLGLDSAISAKGMLSLPEKDVQWLLSLQNLADSTLEGVRRACRDLRPSVLDDLGLHAALEWLSDTSSKRGVPCTFTCDGTPQALSAEVEITIFRIVQEALSNIWRHAHATQAVVALHYLPGCLEVIVRDNGKGFAATSINSGTSFREDGGLGLLGMRERAHLIGAQFSITSSTGNGCTLTLSLPSQIVRA